MIYTCEVDLILPQYMFEDFKCVSKDGYMISKQSV